MSGPGFMSVNDFRKRTVKSPDNPMDRCTIVSIYPRLIDEVKNTIQPGRFTIKPGTYDNPSVLVVGSSSWWKELDEDSPLLEITQSSILVANSIVIDYINGIVGCNMSDAVPGIFFIPGNFTVDAIKKNHKDELDIAKTKQDNWFRVLVQMADTDWARTQGNPLAVSDLSRMAAQELGLKAKPWMEDFQAVELIKCVACGGLRNPLFPICPSCHNVVDKELAKKLDLQFANK